MEFLFEYGLFFAKVVTFVIAIVVILSVAMSAAQHRHGGKEKGRITVTKLNERFEQMASAIKQIAMSEKAFKEDEKARKKADKQKKHSSKQKDTKEEDRKRVYVLDFDGDLKASATDELREAITAVLTLARPTDEVVVRLESGGGLVHSYGLAASQLARITGKGIPLTVCVDKVAASGGYMMACVADKILAAPFAVLGSIGVVAQLPNFNRVLKKLDVDYEVYTAGEYKRTLTLFGENTEKGKEKFLQDLEDTHILFKDFIHEHRQVTDIDDVATGEIWLGRRALEKKLIDGIMTSDEYIFELSTNADVFQVEFEYKKSLPDRIGLGVAGAAEKAFGKIWASLSQRYWS